MLLARPTPRRGQEDMYRNEEDIHLVLDGAVVGVNHPLGKCLDYPLHQPRQADLLTSLLGLVAHLLRDHLPLHRADHSIHPQDQHHNMGAAHANPLLKAY